MLRGAFFVAGTDTGIGKTWVCNQLARDAVAQNLTVATMKPVAAGCEQIDGNWCNEDALILQAASNMNLSYQEVNPIALPLAVSPHLAAAAAGVTIEIPPLVARANKLAVRADLLLVEGAGGWLAPIDARRTMADLAVALGYPVILVVGMRLGCLNHALLTHRSILASGLPFAGWIANCVDPQMSALDENLTTLGSRLGSDPLRVFATF